jgi:hypothetical protein
MSQQKYPQKTSVSSSSTGEKIASGKTNGYSSFHLHAKRKAKRAEAEARQAAYESLTIAEKFATLVTGGSKKQRAKLNEQLADVVASKKEQPAASVKKAKKAK